MPHLRFTIYDLRGVTTDARHALGVRKLERPRLKAGALSRVLAPQTVVSNQQQPIL